MYCQGDLLDFGIRDTNRLFFIPFSSIFFFVYSTGSLCPEGDLRLAIARVLGYEMCPIKNELRFGVIIVSNLLPEINVIFIGSKVAYSL
ncbi:hypothetical protein TNCV_774441 [Trichonephila clavipes]|nr:hypothetical protein TNCV_774441 [Trichonephila clavipes]